MFQKYRHLFGTRQGLNSRKLFRSLISNRFWRMERMPQCLILLQQSYFLVSLYYFLWFSYLITNFCCENQYSSSHSYLELVNRLNTHSSTVPSSWAYLIFHDFHIQSATNSPYLFASKFSILKMKIQINLSFYLPILFCGLKVKTCLASFTCK